MRNRLRSTRCLAVTVCAIVWLGALIPSALHARQAGKSRTEQADAKHKLADLRHKMEALASEQADTAAKRDSVNAELAKQANMLAAAAMAVRQTDAALLAKQQQLEQLQQQRNTLQQTLAGQRAAIADLLRATYALGHGSDLRLLLGDQDVARIARALVYSQYFQRDRVQRVQKLMGDLARLQELQAAITAEQQALQAAKAQREEQAKQLAQQRVTQQKLAAATDARYKDQAQRLAAMKQDAQSLNQLLAQLQKVIDEAAAQRAAAAKARPGHQLPPPPGVSGAGANIRGNLPWPASGAVNSFGNGVLIKAAGGSEVHAVARGRIIYAGFLRGYGMLLIVNHGNGWMSMYGNNESLLHGVGDEVEAGETIGTASAVTGIHTGVYFELRKDGKPVDPRRWLGKQR
ncbi:MAG: peptidase M23 [Rhodanobacter sp.]|nr:MAG: peptidase M23 [Rhodanobacter sp.]TAL88204.1 MAG: peptidase M23 [Rhodanobacter sp.]TAM39451.1 MAG: peptidase M23 [Rhodanobacter sp.]TAN26920.1 MAG: peptidase M23 [Rhodanobacter sp.]